MKPKAGSAKLAAKVSAKAPVKAQAKVPPKAVKGKPALKAAPKTLMKVSKSPKLAQKASGKPVAKVVLKSVSKVVAKAVVKSKAPKLASKAAPPLAKKHPVKLNVKVVNQPVVKAVAKKVAAKVTSKLASKVAPKATVKTNNPKSADKAVAKNVTEVLKRKSEPKGSTVAVAKVAAPVKPIATPAVAAHPAVSSAPAVLAPKAGRPSSRLAQLTVVGMAQSVASTAAKSSYSQTVALPVIVPSMTMAAKKDPKLANNWKTKPVEQLTDPELLSMPDSEYMNDKQMAVFRLKLSVLKQDILNSASDTTEHLREDTVVVPDPADRATIEEEHALELRTRDRERKLLKKIEQSINRIDAGDYGYCDETGEPIGVGRLLARPTATLSLEAQQRRELKQKMFGD